MYEMTERREEEGEMGGISGEREREGRREDREMKGFAY